MHISVIPAEAGIQNPHQQCGIRSQIYPDPDYRRNDGRFDDTAQERSMNIGGLLGQGFSCPNIESVTQVAIQNFLYRPTIAPLCTASRGHKSRRHSSFLSFSRRYRVCPSAPLVSTSANVLIQVCINNQGHLPFPPFLLEKFTAPNLRWAIASVC